MKELKWKILFVDDEERFLDGLRRILYRDREKWDMHYATSVDEAMDKLKSEKFDTVVSDVNMPEKDGFDLLDEMAMDETLKNIPIIILTGNAEFKLKRKALEKGATDLLNKPVVVEDLRARIRNVLQIKEYQDQLKLQNENLELLVLQRTKELEESRVEIILRLAKAGEYRDEDTGNHVLRVGCYSRIIAENLGFDKDFANMIFLTSPLHDIGKIGIPDNILLKPGKLSDKEWKIMRRHCKIGEEILTHNPKGIKLFTTLGGSDICDFEHMLNPLEKMSSTIAMAHHEKWDGSGYPNSLSGEDIPIEGRIVAICDVYDAISSERPYKKAFPEEVTLKILEEGIGKHFDPEVVNAFFESLDEIRAIRSQYSD